MLINYQTVKTTLGNFTLLGSKDGLLQVILPTQETNLQQIGEKPDVNLVESDVYLGAHVEEFQEYFDGKRKVFTAPIDWGTLKGFRREILEKLTKVPYGHVLSYGMLASETSSPLAVRATASACSTNPLPVIIPCHRIVPKSGGAGKYLGGENLKVALLQLEGVKL